MRKYINVVLLLVMALIVSSCGSGATSGDPLGLDTIKVSASPTTVNAGQGSVITATVKHVNGAPATGRSVSFEIPVNNTGGTLLVLNRELNSNGEATALYTAGATSPTSALQDTIRARIDNDASDAVVITRTAGPSPLISLLTSSQTTLNAGQHSIITARVTDSAGSPVSGQTVTFSVLAPAGSGAPTLSAASSVTDGLGNAITIYTPGVGSPTSAVEDVIQAGLSNGSTRPVTIARSGTAVAPAVAAAMLSTLTSSQTTLNAAQHSIITARVTDSAGISVSGQTVTFSILAPAGSGAPTLSAASSVTDGLGNAITIYTPGVGSPTSAVEDVIQAGLSNGSTRAVTITRSATAVAPAVAATLSTLTSSQTTLSAGQNSIITAAVTDSAGSPVSGQTVTFTIPIAASGVPTLSAASSVTDGRGIAVTVYTPGVVSPTSTVEDVIQAGLSNGSTRAVAITRSGGAVTTTSISAMAASNTSVTASQSSIITVKVTNSAGNPVSGETVTFTIPVAGSGAPTLSTGIGVGVLTDSLGNAITIYTPGTLLPASTVDDAILATLTSSGSSKAVIVTRTP